MPRRLRHVVVAALVGMLLFGWIPLIAPAHASPQLIGPAATVAAPHVTPHIAPGVPFPTGMAASVVLGASNLNTVGTVAAAAYSVGVSQGVAMDHQGDLWETDFANSRILEFTPPFVTNESAHLVIGQATFTGTALGTSAVNLSRPAGLTFDRGGDLWVTDFGNSRVLEYLPPFTIGMAASLVLGQQNFAGNQGAVTAVNLSVPLGLIFDSHANLWVDDYSAQRVLEYQPPFSTGMAAHLVIGQPTLTSQVAYSVNATQLAPSGIAFSATGLLYVSDAASGRVMTFYPPFSNGMPASTVLGQASLTSTGAPLPNALRAPTQLAFDPLGDLWVGDEVNNRMAEFTSPSFNNDPVGAVLGQSTLTGNQAATTAKNLSLPFGAVFTPSGAMWVADALNYRLVEFVPSAYTVTLVATGLPSGTSWTASVGGNSQSGTGPLTFSVTNGSFPYSVQPLPGLLPNPAYGQLAVNGGDIVQSIVFGAAPPRPFYNGMPATVELGQINFNAVNYVEGPGLTNASALGYPTSYAAAFDHSGNLWVGDGNNNRVLEFVPPFTSGMAATLVIGQATLGGFTGGTTSVNESFPDGMAFDGSGNLWVADYGNNRVLEYVPPFTNGMAASLVLGQSSFTTRTAGTSAALMSGPSGMGFDHAGDLWVADYGNNRVVEFVPPFATGMSASLVLGQSSFTGNAFGTTATNLSHPEWATSDAHGNLWIADYGNNRVVEYPTPISTGEAATVALGQPSLTVSSNVGENSLAQPNGMVFDSHGNMWVADGLNDRTVEFAGPAFSFNQTPVLALGQGNVSSFGGGAAGRSGENYPTIPMIDSFGNVWVLDSGNARVVGYIPAQYTVQYTETGLAPGTSWSVTVGGVVHTASAATISVVEENGSYSLSVGAQPGYTASPSSGTTVVNGASLVVPVAFTQFTYKVTFTETGLPSGTSWTVTVGSTAHTSSNTTIVVSEPNGTVSWSVTAVSGYTASPSSGSVTVSAGPAGATVAFSSSSKSTSGLGGLSTTDWVLIAVVVAVVVVLAIVLLTRRKKPAPSAPPAPWAEAPPPAAPTTPSTPGTPPPGAG